MFSREDIQNEILTFYKGLLGSSSITLVVDPRVVKRGFLVPSIVAHAMLRPITRKDVTEALWSISIDKAPG